MTPKQFTDALALTESNGNVRAWGDDSDGRHAPLAMGRWQIHPAFLWDITDDDSCMPHELESWDTWVERLIQRWAAPKLKAIEAVYVAEHYHLGHAAHNGSPDWDDQYAQRFLTFAKQIGAQQ